MLAALALIAALFQLAVHSAFKGCLFLAAGSVQRAAGTRDLDSLGGLARRMPVTAALFGIGALSICALPPFSGFASEWLLLQGLLRGFAAHGAATATVLLAGVAALALTGGLTAAAFVKAFGIGFLGQPRTPEAAAAAETGPAMAGRHGAAGRAVPCPRRDPRCRHAAAGQGGGHRPGRHAGSAARRREPGGRRQRGRGPAGAAGHGAPGRPRARLGDCPPARPRPRRARRAEAWGCGREQQTPRMQYTATSFAEPLQRVFDDVLRPDRDLDVSHLAESRYFEQAITYRSRTDDAIERGAYRPLAVLAARWGEVARRAQNGSVHRYLAFGFAALVILLVVLA